MKPRRVEATVAELAPGGEGVAIVEHDGERRAVFVPGVARGERVLLEADFARRPARGTLLQVGSSSSERVTPACAWNETCGGCDWMHLSPAEQVREHGLILQRLLGRAPVAHPAPSALGYRTRARVHVDARRGKVVVGMFGRRTREAVAVDGCVVLVPELDAMRAALPRWLEGCRGQGEAHLALGRPTKEGPRRGVLDLRWKGDALPPAVFARFERATSALAPSSLGAAPLLAGVRLFSGDVRRPATIGDPTPFLDGPDDLPLELAPGGFAQATEEGNRRLAAHVVELAREAPEGLGVELFAGAGNLTVLLARDREIVAVEQDPDACAAGRKNLRARGLGDRAKLVEGDASLFDIPKAARLVVLDPPREGARGVAEGLAKRLVAKKHGPSIVYVSCDPVTLARDVRILEAAGYVLARLDAFEMFPQTSHVETVASLVAPDRRA